MIALLGIVATARAMIWLAPDSQRTGDGDTCKDLRDWSDAYYLLALGAAVVGGLAWGAASLQRDSGYLRLLTFAGVALCAPYVIGSTSLLRPCMRVELTSATARRPTPRRSTIGGPVMRDSLPLILSTTAPLVAAFRSTPLGRPPTTPSPQTASAREKRSAQPSRPNRDSLRTAPRHARAPVRAWPPTRVAGCTSSSPDTADVTS
jgi:hypothetical protein